MKNIIAVTACLKRCSIAISYEGNLHEINENVDAAANLVHLANELVKAKNIDVKKLEGVITASGPGSFTGIRVAQSFAKGMALALKIPSASVNYFDVIKDSCIDEISQDTLVVIKSEKGQIYYEINSENFHEMGVAVAERMKSLVPGKIFLMGDALDEVGGHLGDKIMSFRSMKNFREAKHLINFAKILDKKSKISPLYINARS
jgi:tRNA threonylcarbamoyl adenosine modification protein YeaZ